MTRQEIESSGYAIPNHSMKLGNRTVNCAKISEVEANS